MTDNAEQVARGYGQERAGPWRSGARRCAGVRQMTRLALCAALLMLCTAPATAGVFEVVCVTPEFDNDGSCDSVVAIPRVGPLWVHLQWQSTVRGGAAGHDSLTAAGGDTLAFVRWIPAGEYRTRLWASDTGGIGCVFDTVRTVRGWPGAVRFVK